MFYDENNGGIKGGTVGPLMLDCQAELLQPEEREKLAHPVTGGVILFTRNFYDKQQLATLVKDIRQSAKKPVLIAVDHEGGRVQRFREGFTRIPAMGDIQQSGASNADSEALAQACGMALAYELKSLDIDFSFAPVLDINGVSQVIGDRAFADNAEDVVRLASHLIAGLREVNMPAIGKHFPGHGSVAPDSHVALPVDERSYNEIHHTDMVVFERLIQKALLDGVMPAHVIYNQVCPQPAGFSAHWLQTVLKQSLGFQGAVFSDDLSMHGASVAGDYPERAEIALDAGCDMVLACNNPAGAERILDSLEKRVSAQHAEDIKKHQRVRVLHRRNMPKGLETRYNEATALIEGMASKRY